MNWLQKIAGPTLSDEYIDIGHGREIRDWNKDKNMGKVILWEYDNGRIIDVERSDDVLYHTDMNTNSHQAKGRIEVDRGIGSLAFFQLFDRDSRLKQKIISTVINKYPGIKFVVYPEKISVQKYWNMLESGEA
ncbi:MAG: hypothetical protein ACXAC2_24775 [Candidatus Kariarchaeaceae archaeon]|jgi:hypothetical protein